VFLVSCAVQGLAGEAVQGLAGEAVSVPGVIGGCNLCLCELMQVCPLCSIARAQGSDKHDTLVLVLQSRWMAIHIWMVKKHASHASQLVKAWYWSCWAEGCTGRLAVPAETRIGDVSNPRIANQPYPYLVRFLCNWVLQ
jgi:hypothetical protein